MLTKDDKDLMLDFQEGTDEAMPILYQRYLKRIFSFCLRILGNRPDAEDVTQEVFIKLFKRSYRFDENAKFSTWLFTIARNASLDCIRKRKKDVPLEEWTTVAEEHAQSSAHSVHETSNLLNEALHLLPVEQKEILILREYQSFSYKEISEILNCSLVNVKILIFRAREQLKVRLQTLLQEGADND